ncbi:hypothetical protein MRB53_040643 [Persea americana]|nr:hypothetical protein MRB53_040643 [Persea americana]
MMLQSLGTTESDKAGSAGCDIGWSGCAVFSYPTTLMISGDRVAKSALAVAIRNRSLSTACLRAPEDSYEVEKYK